PANFDELLDDPRVEARFYKDQDEFMPYWAEFWPASLLLADAIAAWPRPAADREAPLVLELGCGLGLISLVAAERGYRVIASDYDDDALAFVAENVRRNGVAGVTTRFIDWRQTYDDLRPDRIVAAEVTYESRSLEPIAAFLRTHLRPGGEVLFVDRNRGVADPFAKVVKEHGLEMNVTSAERPDADGKLISGRFFRLWHAGHPPMMDTDAG
ncbi:MAG: methyltransferase domain-containing protein, partial [Phycisphaerae bacterium]|nr:methyltransferase domain-containing protein [Phycisphaerae bacterium]